GRPPPGPRHPVEPPRREAEQQEDDHPPRRGPQPAIDQPAHGRTDQDAGDELGREPKAARDRRRIGGGTLTPATFGGAGGGGVAEPRTETREPRRGRRPLPPPFFAITLFPPP